jgi:signal transduction histidine kinase/CheY-like chemotaxis protein/HAMP domain-containing protein
MRSIEKYCFLTCLDYNNIDRNMKKYKSIKTRTTIYTLIPVVIGFIIICSIMFVSLFNAQRNIVMAEFECIIRRHTSSFEKKINNAIDYLSFVANMIEFQINENVSDRELLQKQMLDFFNRYPGINSSSFFFEPNAYDGKDSMYRGTEFGTALSGRISYYLARENGKPILTLTNMENETLFLDTFYLFTRERNSPYFTAPATYDIYGEDILMCIIVFPIQDRSGAFIGAISANIFVGDIFEQLQQETILETGYIIIATDKNEVIYSPRFEDIGKVLDDIGFTYYLPENTNEIVFFDCKSILNGKRTLSAVNTVFFPELNTHFSISVSAPYNEINASGAKIVIIVLLLSIATIVIIAFFMSHLIGKATSPLKEFAANAEKFGSGDFSTRITGNYDDEFSILKDSVNLMTERIEANVEESKKTLGVLHNILNGINAFLYVTIPKTGEILFINNQMKDAFGIKDDVIGQYCYKVLQDGYETICNFCPCHQLDQNPNAPVIWEEHNTVTKRYYKNMDCYIDWLDGVKVHLQHSVDITDVKLITEEKIRAEREAQDLAQKKAHAEESSRMKSVFLASMSHEIRTPMHGIIGFSELALDENLSPKSRNYVSKIKTSAESLLLIINDILDVSKIEAGKIELENIPFDIGEVFRLCRLIAYPNAREKGLTLFCYAEPSIGKLLLGDPTRLRQVLLNLLSNAIKFTNNGMVKLLAAISAKTQTHVTMHFEIKDSGIGMTDEQVRKIFQPFTQADDTTTRKYGGTGLGLTITKSFVELMGGTLHVESSSGVGSKFSFDITFETVDAVSTPLQIDISANLCEKPVFEGEILICEDNDLNKIVITDHLAKIGLKSVIAENGRIGVEFIKNRIENGQKPFDLIFMDIHMPEMDGLEAAKRIIALGSRVPIVALTANIMPNDRDSYFASGMVDCLPKPFVVNELWACLLKYLTPVNMVALNKETNFSEEEEQRMELISAFIESNKDTYKNIRTALETGDIKFAHRLVHTLKSVAALIGMNLLSEAAKVVEQSLALGTVNEIQKQMDTLEKELTETLEKLTPIADKYLNNVLKVPCETLTNEKSLEILKKLDGLLEADSFDSLSMVKEIKLIRETEQLVEQVEKMKFKQARKTLSVIMQKFTESE